MGTLYAVFDGKVDIWPCAPERHLAALVEAQRTRPTAPIGTVPGLMRGVRLYVRNGVHGLLRMPLQDGNSWALGTNLRKRHQIGAWQRGDGADREGSFKMHGRRRIVPTTRC